MSDSSDLARIHDAILMDREAELGTYMDKRRCSGARQLCCDSQAAPLTGWRRRGSHAKNQRRYSSTGPTLSVGFGHFDGYGK